MSFSTFWFCFFASADDDTIGWSNDGDGNSSSSSTNEEEGEEEGCTSSPEVDEPKLLEWAEGATPLKGLHEGGWAGGSMGGSVALCLYFGGQ